MHINTHTTFHFHCHAIHKPSQNKPRKCKCTKQNNLNLICQIPMKANRVQWESGRIGKGREEREGRGWGCGCTLWIFGRSANSVRPSSSFRHSPRRLFIIIFESRNTVGMECPYLYSPTCLPTTGSLLPDWRVLHRPWLRRTRTPAKKAEVGEFRNSH